MVSSSAHGGFSGPDALGQAVGCALAPTRWVPVQQEMLRQYAVLTGDDQPLHGAGGPGDGPVVAQGALLIGLAVGLLHEVYRLPWAARLWQAGYDDVRFRTPVLAGSMLRLLATPRQLRPRGHGRYWLATDVHLELRDWRAPAMTGTFLSIIETTASGVSAP